MKTLLNLKLFILVVSMLSIVACGGGGGTTTPTENQPPVDTPPASITGSISGLVQDAKTNLPVEGLSVSVGTTTAMTSATGQYTLETVNSGERLVVTIAGSGYAEQSKIVSLTKQDQAVVLGVSVLPVDLIEDFDPDLAVDLNVVGSTAMVQLSATSLLQEDGSAPSGMVTINLTVIDPTTDIELMPGDMQTDTTGGSLAQIESFGAITATFKDAAGNDLNLANGSPATIRIPVASNTANPPANIPLYFYNKITGLWVEEGSATLDPTGSFYEGSVTHFSTWNADRIFERVSINGCVVDTSGTRLENISVYSSGIDYSGRSYDFTDEAGNFSVFAKSNASVAIFGRRFFRQTNTVEVQTAISDITLADCLILADTSAGVGDGEGTLTLSGVGAAQLGSQVTFNDVVNIYGFLNSGVLYILGGEDEDVLNPTPGQIDNNNTVGIQIFSDFNEHTIIISFINDGQTQLIYCSTSDLIGSCGAGFITLDTNARTITFSNAVLVGLLDNSQNFVDTVINGTLTWRDYDSVGLGGL